MSAAGGATEDVGEREIADALDALERGDIEYVILEDGEEFVQAAGSGAGPYAVEWQPRGGGPLREVPGGASAETMRSVIGAFGRRDATWSGGVSWSDA